jgi:hypothetical protein
VGSREGLPEGDEEEPVLVLVVVSVVLIVVKEAVVRGSEGFEVEGLLPPLPSSASFDPSSSGIHRRTVARWGSSARVPSTVGAGGSWRAVFSEVRGGCQTTTKIERFRHFEFNLGLLRE